MSLRVAVAVICCLFVLVGAASFVVAPEASEPEPAPFDRTVAMGMTLEEQRMLGADRFAPRAQVAYSQFPYVVGYRGIGLAASAVDDPLVEQQFGYPQSVYVEAAPSDVSLDGSGYPVGGYTDEWIPADDAHVVVDSAARTPSGPTQLAFADHERAAEFADEYGGEVVDWDDRGRFDVPTSDGSTARNRVETQHEDADATVEATRELLDRPVGTVVGEDEPTLRAALDTAEANTTILLPQGTYEGPAEVDKPVTIRGSNATIEGDGNGTVLTVTADDVAITGVSIEGVGESLHPDDSSKASDRPAWDRATEEAYGYADAAVTADSVDRLLVTRSEVESPASGIILRDTDRAVVDRVRFEGSDRWQSGFMGVTAIRSPAIVQDSTFDGGRDGVYAHRSSGITIRDNNFIGGRFGTHFMYTSEALFADNCATGQALSGVVIMTSPSGIAIAENVITDTKQGILTSGSDVYVGENVIVGTEQGISTSARNSLYADNAVVGNTVGFRASSIFPTSVVVGNDVVDNDQHVRATSGPLRVWSNDGRGNYWDGAAGLDRRYSPTDPVDGRLHRTGAARTLSDAPIVRGLRTLRGEAPGMRGESVIDAHPRSTPANATRLETAQALADGDATLQGGCGA
ncbi:NosD domain-containing protein [Natronomonas sp. LN261]|uniref:NosD domain-containing protein n=1 Tax=Natronomonas sp. LN261 TaxID=2750669 RepID=UPI0015EF2782|nr:NosD domain-containing protein [Natronomonas sp. LN261]